MERGRFLAIATVAMLKLLGLIPLLLLPALVNAESLADIARRTAEERKSRETASETGKVYGNEDLDGAHQQRRREAGEPDGSNEPEDATKASPARSEQPDNAAATPVPDREPRQRETDEAMWRKRLEEARQRVDDAWKQYDSRRESYLRLAQRLQQDDRFRNPGGLEESRRVLDLAFGNWKAAQEDLENLLGNARRAGVPSEWLE